MISASIVLYRTPTALIEQVLGCILNSNFEVNIYLIDNSPCEYNYSTEFFDFLYRKKISYFKSPKNIGYGAGHNIALRNIHNTSRYHFVINPDIYFEEDVIISMITRMNSDEGIGQLSPKIVSSNNELQYLCKLIPTPIDLVIRRFSFGLARDFFGKRISYNEMSFANYDSEFEAPYLSGCFMLFRMSALNEIGYFDERFFMYPEDLDITRRMHTKYKTVYYPSVKVVHIHGKESYKNFRMLSIHIINMIKYFNKWGWFFDKDRNKINNSIINKIKGK
jgi:GT2 family glycosyltransferase